MSRRRSENAKFTAVMPLLPEGTAPERAKPRLYSRLPQPLHFFTGETRGASEEEKCLLPWHRLQRPGAKKPRGRAALPPASSSAGARRPRAKLRGGSTGGGGAAGERRQRLLDEELHVSAVSPAGAEPAVSVSQRGDGRLPGDRAATLPGMPKPPRPR